MKWYEIKGKKDISEIWLYDEIGLYGVTAKEFIAELNAVKSPKIEMHINSPGGGVFDGHAIYNAVKRHPSEVTSLIDGLAASMASVIALAGDRVVMAKNAMFMMHNPHGVVIGTSEDMRKTADVLDKVRDTMIGAYSNKSGKERENIISLLDNAVYLNADEALEAGFIDEIGDKTMDLAACAKFVPALEKLGLKNIPKEIRGDSGTPSKRELERTLIEHGGCSQKLAKAILSEGYPGDYRDDDPAQDASPPANQNHRDDDSDAHRDDVQPKNERKDKTAELLIRAERVLAAK